MNLFLRVDINIIAMIMLLLVYVVAYRRLEKKDSFNKMFITISLIILFQLFLETTTCLINNRPQLWLIPVTEVLHIFLFTIAPILTCYWYFLIQKLVKPIEVSSKKRYLLFWLPVALNFVLTILSPVLHFVFYIDKANGYHRGPLYLVSAAITYFYIVCALFLIIKNRRELPKQDFHILSLFIGFPICGGLVQTLFYGPLLIWSCAAFSLVIVFIFLQQRMVKLDDLTGAWDRGSFEYFITQRLENGNKKFGLIYVDIDKLKEINDTFGHMEGDYALKMAVTLIRNVIHKDDFVIRQGGDEFLIIINCEMKEVLDKIIERMEATFAEYNINSVKKYRLECSFGGDIFNSSYSSIEMFINHVDNLMYQNKNEKRIKLKR